MKPAPFTYHAPNTLDEALELMDTLDNARLLAGGQSLVPMLNYRVAQPDHLVDLGRIPELVGVDGEGDGLRIGAMTTQRTVERSALVQERCPLLLAALDHVGHQQTRNRGTIGGSLCHLDPAAELPVVAMVLEPVLTIASRAGRRELSFYDFPAGYLTTQIQPNEVLLHIDLPPRVQGSGWAFEEFARRPADFAIVSVAVLLTRDADDRVEHARIAIGGLGGTPLDAAEAARCFVGGRIEERLDHAAEAVRNLPADGDSNHPADYRYDLAETLLRRALFTAWERAEAQHV